jgi:alpha-L-fucosidase 2
MNFTTTLRRLALPLIAAIAGTVMLAPAAAHADETLYNIGIAPYSDYYAGVLDVAGGSTAAGAKVIQYSVTGGANQRWDVRPTVGGSHIVNVKSQLCLETNGVAGTQLFVTYCNDANARQVWNFSAPRFTLLNPNAPWADQHGGEISNPWTGFRIDVSGGSRLNGTPVIGWPRNFGDNQSFAYWPWN